jgi:hypothetical protein
MYRRFLVDGHLTHLPSSLPLGQSVATPLNETYAVAPDFDPLEDDPELKSFIPSITWTFTKSRKGKRGQFVRLNRWPSYTTSRSADDWGWVLNSDWVVYRSCCPATVARGREWTGCGPRGGDGGERSSSSSEDLSGSDEDEWSADEEEG